MAVVVDEYDSSAVSAARGVKTYTGKPRLELVPPEAMFAMGTVFGKGAEKHAVRGWETGTAWTVYLGAALRHLFLWAGGARGTRKNFAFGDRDDETECSHLWHALCCVAILVAYEDRGIGEDDR